MEHSIKLGLIRCVSMVSVLALISSCSHSPSTSSSNTQAPTYKTACNTNPYLMKYNCSIRAVQQAAENGNADAQYALGYMYYYGIGTVKDQQTAALWIERAAAAGQPLARKAWTLINTGATFNDLHDAASGVERQNSQASSMVIQQEPRNVQEMNATTHQEPITTYLPAYNSTRPENQPSKEIPQMMQQQYPTGNAASAPTQNSSYQTIPPTSMNGLPGQASTAESHAYTMQLMASNHLSDVKAFMAQHNLNNKAQYHVTERDGQPRYIVTYGNYQTQDEAVAALQQLPPDLQANHPWVKSFASVQQETQGSRVIG